MSERGYSPAMSSLNHSYETLNMSEESVAAVAAPAPRLPHRPAPPIPSLLPKMLMTAKEREYLQQHLDDEMRNEEARAAGGGGGKKANSRKSLRQRKIHSLKRQIQIKEKMLEVCTF